MVIVCVVLRSCGDDGGLDAGGRDWVWFQLVETGPVAGIRSWVREIGRVLCAASSE